jgi:hypothetical protein
MVNIRQTLQKAERVGVITEELHATLVKIGKDLFYPDRTYTLIIRRALECGLPRDQLDRLRHWLPESRVDQKRKDAVAMLQLIRERLAEGLKPKIVSYCFQHTQMWELACRQSPELCFDLNCKPS